VILWTVGLTVNEEEQRYSKMMNFKKDTEEPSTAVIERETQGDPGLRRRVFIPDLVRYIAQFIPWYEILPVKAVSKVFDSSLLDLPGWKTIVGYLNKINRLDTKNPSAYAEKHLPIADDPRIQDGWEALSSFAQAMKLLAFQKKCVKNLLS